MRKLLGVATVLACCGLALGQTWDEIADGGGDTGSLPATAQVVSGSGPLTDITGFTDGARGDREDLYLIRIIDPVGFLAHTDPSGGGDANFDTQLWLFDAGGFGILANDDKAGGSAFRSWLKLPADDGTMPVLPGVGNYYIGVTGFNNDALSVGGQIFSPAGFTEVSGPDGPGGGSTVNGWTGAGATGEYRIHLDGAEFVPEPASLVLLGLGGLALIRRR